MATPNDVIDLVDSRTGELLLALDALDDADMRAPSLLPGWTRGHVVTHLARNADALGNLFHWAETGEETPAYASRDARDADIEAGAHRSADALLDDLTEASVRWIVTARRLPEEAWARVVTHRPGREIPGSWIPMLRAGEVILHHYDLALGYEPEQWPGGWVSLALHDAAGGLADRAGEPLALRAIDSGFGVGDGGGRTVSGTQADLLAWVTRGRVGDSLTTTGDLPELGPWR
ncbi:maleylpyruvate isomerase family mycothiol-dependent enzyme [Mumia zhuanghuii]|uniref:Maleylpyruvate isomerase family mycothiol-dependent enzyme n=2 Tax=Mumia TaxID=1546255 RepID=A0ABW1QRF5_9ACTN|nr:MULTISPECIES: maleylpyruvate isomerase family mycothiol-dependent enzyme [Mumia]KAA1420009.1 maleylpyruvate isomerase family mycothiol-dependent enzyme [Mumia zhuanghuii]